MLVALTELNSSLLSMYAGCSVLFAITCYLFDISFVNCGIFQHCSSLGIWKNRKYKRSCQSVWTVNSHKILYRQSWIKLNSFSTQICMLCVFQIFVSNMGSCMNGKYLLKSFKVWIKKKYFYFCKLLYYILLQFLFIFSVEPFLVLKNHCT